MREWETWGFIGSTGKYATPPTNQEEIEICFTVFFASTVPEAQEILQSPAGERILQEAKNRGWSTYDIIKEMQNYVDYTNEKEANAETANVQETITNGSGGSIP